MAYSSEKFRELVLYVASKSVDDRNFGATKLNKILFYSDFLAYLMLGEPITGATYQKLDFGPAPRELMVEQQRLIASSEAAQAEQIVFDKRQKRLVALRPAKLDAFRAAEISLVDSIVQELRDKNATEVSELSHLQLGWRIAEPRTEIPYESAFIRDEEPTQADIRYGQEIAEEHGWMAPAL